ncbi:MAG: glycosyl transferase, group 1 [uncultured bacterium (gcode 4)]|uniref:Glycosyl transferase, group 1 n=1 Tax=uncultured bacterium (gcode 4) TaxID=1234023 RepID=K2AY90_9BACT|nr:MAG: glycosyl transferase, group 1 [uncultured bacterium (gcode 4)]
MKIAVLHPQAKVMGWAVKMLFLISTYLQDKNSVDFYTFSFDKANCFPELNKNLNIINLNLKWFSKFFWIISLSFSLRKYDIILAWNSPMHFVAVLAKIFNPRLKIFWYLQNIPVYYLPQNKSILVYFKRFVERLIIGKIDKIISNSNFIRNEVLKYFKAKSDVIYPVIDTEFFIRDRSPPGDRSQDQNLFINWRLVKWKNVELAIRSFFELKDKYPNLKLYISWNWEEKSKLQKLSQNNKDIIFLWEINQEEVRTYYQMCNISLFTSKIDSFGLTIIEAMSCEKPVVSLTLGWATEIIEDWKTGFLAKDETEFIKKVDNLLQNPELRATIWQNARQFVVNNFSLKTLYNKLNEIFCI